MMEEQKLSTVTVNAETTRIMAKQPEALEVFNANGFDPAARFDIDRAWFVHSLGQDHSHPIWTLLKEAQSLFEVNLNTLPFQKP
jgi:hypothetical protein